MFCVVMNILFNCYVKGGRIRLPIIVEEEWLKIEAVSGNLL